MLIFGCFRSHLIEEENRKKTNWTEVVIHFGGMTSPVQELDAIVNKLYKDYFKSISVCGYIVKLMGIWHWKKKAVFT